MERGKRIDALLSMLQTEPKDVFLNYSLGIEYISENNLSMAELQFVKVLELQNNYIPAFYQLGKLYEQKGQFKMALKYYTEGQELAKIQANSKAFNEFSEAIFMLD